MRIVQLLDPRTAIWRSAERRADEYRRSLPALFVRTAEANVIPQRNDAVPWHLTSGTPGLCAGNRFISRHGFVRLPPSQSEVVPSQVFPTTMAANRLASRTKGICPFHLS